MESTTCCCWLRRCAKRAQFDETIQGICGSSWRVTSLKSTDLLKHAARQPSINFRVGRVDVQGRVAAGAAPAARQKYSMTLIPCQPSLKFSACMLTAGWRHRFPAQTEKREAAPSRPRPPTGARGVREAVGTTGRRTGRLRCRCSSRSLLAPRVDGGKRERAAWWFPVSQVRACRIF